MNRTIRNLVVAAPLATITLTLVPVGAATADIDGPVIIGQPNGGDPEPKPEFPIGIPEPEPEGPLDEAAQPEPKAPQPQGPQAPVAPAEDDEEADVVSAKGSADSIDHSDTLLVAGQDELVVADQTDGGLDLTWLLVGGGIVTASGIAFAARKRSNA